MTLIIMVANHGSKGVNISSGKFDNQKIDADINNHGNHGYVNCHILINIGGSSGEKVFILFDLTEIRKGWKSSNIWKHSLGESSQLCSVHHEQGISLK